MKRPPGFECHKLDGTHTFYTGSLHDSLVLNGIQFEELWQMHPPDYQPLRMRWGVIPAPRWQQAFGMDYYYTRRVNKALPTPPLLVPLLSWAKENLDQRLNGILVNWYDGRLGHHIGPHSDSTRNMIPNTPIVTISFGEQRVFRLRPWRSQGHINFPAVTGAVFIMPFDTNQAWTHEVPASKRLRGRRISVTLRALTELKEENENTTLKVEGCTNNQRKETES